MGISSSKSPLTPIPDDAPPIPDDLLQDFCRRYHLKATRLPLLRPLVDALVQQGGLASLWAKHESRGGAMLQPKATLFVQELYRRLGCPVSKTTAKTLFSNFSAQAASLFHGGAPAPKGPSRSDLTSFLQQALARDRRVFAMAPCNLFSAHGACSLKDACPFGHYPDPTRPSSSSSTSTTTTTAPRTPAPSASSSNVPRVIPTLPARPSSSSSTTSAYIPRNQPQTATARNHASHPTDHQDDDATHYFLESYYDQQRSSAPSSSSSFLPGTASPFYARHPVAAQALLRYAAQAKQHRAVFSGTCLPSFAPLGFLPHLRGFSPLVSLPSLRSSSTSSSSSSRASLRSSVSQAGSSLWGVGGAFASAYNYLPDASSSRTIATSNARVPLPAEPLGDHALAQCGLSPEHVVVDCRLEYPSLLRFDSSVEVFMLEGTAADGESDLCVAFPVRPADDAMPLFSESWRRSDGGWMWVPQVALSPGALDGGVVMPNDWFAGLRYHVDPGVRQHWSFLHFSSGALRLFLLPLPSEQCTRVLAVTHSPVLYPLLLKEPQSKLARVVSHYMLTPMTGEWQQTFTEHREDVLASLLGQGAPVPAFADADADLSKPNAPLMMNNTSSTTTTTSSSSSSSFSNTIESINDVEDDVDGECDSEELNLLDYFPNEEPPALSARAMLRSSGAYFSEPPVIIPDDGSELPSSSSSSSSTSSSLIAPPVLTADQTTLPLFPHQRRTVAWIHRRECQDRESFHYPQVRRFYNLYGYQHGWEDRQLLPTVEILHADLPRGGCVAHSVGAGKTVISAGLLAQTAARPPDHPQFGPTLVVVPDHIAVQWRRELARFAPQLQVVAAPFSASRLDASQVAIVHFSELEALMSQLQTVPWTRMIIDEPHELQADVTGIPAKFRWALTATPEPLKAVMEAVWGEEIPAPFDQVLRAPFIRHCARRDPPGECLPVPPLRVQMVPVTLTWQESSVVQMETMNGNLTRSVRYCSYFKTGQQQASPSQQPQEAPTKLQTLDQWVGSFQQKYQKETEGLAEQAGALQKVISAQMALSSASQAEVHAKQSARREALMAALEGEKDVAYAALEARHPQTPELLAIVQQMRESLVVPKHPARRRGRSKKLREASCEEEDEIFALMTIWLKYFKTPDEEEGDGEDGEDGEKADGASIGRSGSSHAKQQKGKPPKARGPTSPDWEANNELETRIVYLSALMQLRRHFSAREHEILDQTNALSAEDIFDSVDMGSVDPLLLNRLNEVTARREVIQKTLSFLGNVESTLRNPDAECAICFELLQGVEISLFKCLHAFCSPCVVSTFRQATEASCPMCRVKSLKRDVCTFTCVSGAPEAQQQAPQSSAQASAPPPRPFYGSKIETLINAIQAILGATQDKIVVFGQWSRLISNVHRALLSAGIHSQALSDQMDLRCEQIDFFRNDPDHRVLLLSSENQSSGINLDVANHVFILHPRVVPGTIMPLLESQAFEKQAVGRVHRYPQTKEVHVYRLYARGSVEEELYALCGYFN